MTGISHEQARRYMLALSDNLLGEPEKQLLRTHLQGCSQCSHEADRLDQLHSQLRSAFKEHWDEVQPPVKPLVSSLPPIESIGMRLGRFAINLALFGLWVWLYRSVFDYLRIIFTDSEFRTNQFLLAGVLILLLIQFRKQNLQPKVDTLPQLYLPGLVLMIGCSAIYLIVERLVDINTLSASLFGLATYGFIGLWMSPRRWRGGLPAALLLVGVLPFGDHLETFVGYPMRLATAWILQNGFGALGVHSVTVDTILILESGLAQIDIPCSGVRSLWTGGLFLVAATWLEGRTINLRWFVIAFLMVGMLFLANVARIGTLVLIDTVFGMKLLSELVHVPLGVLAFTGVCGAVVLLLRTQSSNSWSTGAARQDPYTDRLPKDAKKPLWLAPLLASLIAAMALLYQPHPQLAAAQADIHWQFPVEMEVLPEPLSPELRAWVDQDGKVSTDRWHFDWHSGTDSLTGDIMFIISDDWRAQHKPERCFEVQGDRVESSQTIWLGEEFSYRLLRLSRGPLQVSALYWLQNGNRAIDDFATRIWADLTPEKTRWVLVTVLLDEVYPPESTAVQTLANSLRSVVMESLGEK